MPEFKIKATETSTYIVDVEADTIEEAIDMVENGDAEDMVEQDCSHLAPYEYTIEGQMGWNSVADLESENTPYGDTLMSESNSVYCRGCGSEWQYPVDDDGNACPHDCDNCGVDLGVYPANTVERPEIVHDVTKAQVMDTLFGLGNRIVMVAEQPRHADVVRRMWIELCQHRGTQP